MIKVTDDEIYVDVVTSIYKDKLLPVKDQTGKDVKDENGKVIKALQETWCQDIKLKTSFLKDGITTKGETLTRGNKKSKSRCIIYDRYTGKFFTIAHSLKELEAALSTQGVRQAVGFKRY